MLVERLATPPLLLEGDGEPDLVPETEEDGRDAPLEVGVDDAPEVGTLEGAAKKVNG